MKILVALAMAASLARVASPAEQSGRGDCDAMSAGAAPRTAKKG